jgi:outer membrane protein assembly factor BamB
MAGGRRGPFVFPAASWALLWLAAALAAGGCSVPPVAPERLALERIDSDVRVEGLWYRQPQQTAEPAREILSPLALGGRIFHADRPGRLVALEATSGRILWRRDITPPGDSLDPAVHLSGGIGAGADLLLIGTREGRVIALDPANGTVRWETQLSSEISAAPVASGRIVIARTHDGRLYALDAASGNRLWVYSSAAPPLTLRGAGRALIDGDRVYAGFSSGKLAALALDDGEVLWEIAVGTPEGRSEFERLVDVDADPVLAANTVFAASYQNRLVAISTISGRIVWSRDLSIFQNLLLDGATLYITTEQDGIMAIDRANGNVLWRQDMLASRGLSAPVMFRGRIVVADRQGYLHWLSPDDGALTGRYRISDAPVRAPLVVSEGALYVIDDRNGLRAIRTAVN